MDEAIAMRIFIVGDTVTWVSQGRGKTTTKEGVIVAVVPANHYPLHQLDTRPYRYLFDGMTRSEESYLVAVPGPTTGAKARLYHPRSALLRLTLPQRA